MSEVFPKGGADDVRFGLVPTDAGSQTARFQPQESWRAMRVCCRWASALRAWEFSTPQHCFISRR